LLGDAHTDSTAATTPAGSATSLRVSSTSAAFLKFDLSAVPPGMTVEPATGQPRAAARRRMAHPFRRAHGRPRGPGTPVIGAGTGAVDGRDVFDDAHPPALPHTCARFEALGRLFRTNT
jgi:hypothetical protein